MFRSYSESVGLLAFSSSQQFSAFYTARQVAVSIERSVLGDGSGGDVRHLLSR